MPLNTSLQPPHKVDFIQALQSLGLEFSVHSRYLNFTCPACTKRKKVYVYFQLPNGKPNYRGSWWCSRRGECRATGKLWPDGLRSNFTPSPKFKARKAKPKKETRPEGHTKAIKKSLGFLPRDTEIYLVKERGFTPQDLQDLKDQKILGTTSQAKGHPASGKYARSGYELLVPLHDLKTGEIISAQARFIPTKNRPKRPSQWPKAKSLPGGYGEAGSVFGDINKALIEATKNSRRLYLVEGLPDYLTVHACQISNFIGVPGVGMAVRAARELIERNWKGELVLCLDGDKAGANNVQKVVEELQKSKCADITPLNAGPLQGDLNDLFKIGGKQAILELLKNPRAIPRPEYIEPIGLSREGKAKARALYFEIKKAHSPARSKARIGVCGVLVEQALRYSLENGQLKSTILKVCPRACEGQSCYYCRPKRWLKLLKHTREHWPETLYMAKVKLEENRPDLARDLRSKLSSKSKKARKENGGAYRAALDVYEGSLLVVTNHENPKLTLALENELGQKLLPVSREEALDALKHCYMSFARQIIDVFEDHDLTLEKLMADPWANRRVTWCSGGGEGLEFVKEKDITKELIKDAKEKREERQEQEGAKEKNQFDLYLYKKPTTEGPRLVGVTLFPLVPKNLMNLLEDKPLKLTLGDPGNLLEDPGQAGPTVEQFLQDLHLKHNGELIAKGQTQSEHMPLNSLSPQQEQIYYGKRAVLEDMRRLLESVRRQE